MEHGIHVENDRHMWEEDGRTKGERKKMWEHVRHMLKQEGRMWDNGRNMVDGKMGLGYTNEGRKSQGLE
jgi:hypothetical protein